MSTTALPEEIHLDDWQVSLYFTHLFAESAINAEIFDLTPIDVPFVPGDFNGDGMVDARDLGVWRYAYRAIDANLAADANLDDLVDGGDFLAWQRQLGQSGSDAPGSAVPEPGALALGLLAMFGIGAGTRPAVAALCGNGAVGRGKRGFSGRTKVV